MSEVFELHFKKKPEEDLSFDSFCYEPENIYEKRLGSLYVVGELKNALPQNEKLIHKIAGTVKTKFYAFPINSFEKSFEESLKSANDFLTEEVKNDNTSWLGNLNLGIIAVKNFEINLSKVGNIKILLLRKGQINDIGERLKFQDIEPYPLKVFSNIATGKLIENDQLMILTEETYQAFSIETQLVNEISQLQVEDKSYARNLKKVLKQKEKILAQISGICLLVTITPEVLPKKAFKFEKEAPAFSIREAFAPLTNGIKNFLGFFKKLTFAARTKTKEKFSGIQTKGGEKFVFKNPLSPILAKINSLRKIKMLKFPSFASLAENKELKKKARLVALFILILGLGFFIFKTGSQRELKKAQETLTKIQADVTAAKALIGQDNQKANESLQSLFNQILDLEAGAPPALTDDIGKLENEVLTNLYSLNKITIIEDPQLISKIDSKESVPQRMVVLGKSIYLFSPISENLFIVNENGNGALITTGKPFNSATVSNNIILFTRPSLVTPLEEEPFSITLPSSESDFGDLFFFKNNLYFLDSESGEILKYPYGSSTGNQYFIATTKKPSNPLSLAVDGSVWILTSNNEIYRYYVGQYQNTLKIETFPKVKNLQKIFASFALPYLYILEPAENRLIIANKEGAIVKQFKSDKFDNLKDFAVSGDGKTIYFLNSQEIYRVQF